jgi:hypothetical protein
MAELSEDDPQKRKVAAFALPNCLGRFQTEADKAIFSRKSTGKA